MFREYFIILLLLLFLNHGIVLCRNSSVEDVESLSQQLHELQEKVETGKRDRDKMWVLICGILVFFMQAGFAYLEAGSVRVKNVISILTKNFADACVALVFYWCLGYGLAFGVDKASGTRNGFVGNSDFLLLSPGFRDYHLFFFHWAFSATSATIVSGAVAERCEFTAYLLYTAFITGWIYPVVTHWFWSESGFLSPFANPAEVSRLGTVGYIDFAGSGVIHCLGGVLATICCVIMGSRTGRWDKDRSQEFRPHSISLIALGVLILWVGWYGFNGGSTLAFSGSSSMIASKVEVNSTVSAAFGGLSCLFIGRIFYGFWDICILMNGILAGLVSITASCATVEPWSAVVIGCIGSTMYLISSKIYKLLRIDDPVDAGPLHGTCGFWGVIAAGIFSSPDNIKTVYHVDSTGSLLWGNFEQIGIQILGVLIIIVWSSVWGLGLFGSLRLINLIPVVGKYIGLRVNKMAEQRGLDEDAHGGDAYRFEKSIHITDVLDSPTLTKDFEQFCNIELSSENLSCWKAMEDYKCIAEGEKRKKKAAEIYDEFIDVHAAKSVNVNDELRKQIREKLENSQTTPIDLFDDFQVELKLIMGDTLNRFKSHQLFQNVQKKFSKEEKKNT